MSSEFVATKRSRAVKSEEDGESSAKVLKLTRQPQTSKGTIVELTMHNFLTFDHAVFTPGPQLNVIVGPNGTGKSSIVCAICLGLGGQPRLLGRAKEIRDFVKHGKDSAYIEVKLAKPGRPLVVRRNMSSSNNNSKWSINGVEKLEKDVVREVSGLNIQLENRCQFLPQDMVVEFAKMDKYLLLEETEKAFGNEDGENLLSKHEKLKNFKKDMELATRSVRRLEVNLGDLEQQNKLLERDVRRLRSMEEFEKKLKDLKLKKLWTEYTDARNDFCESKKKKKSAEKKLKATTERHKPIEEKRKAMDTAVKRFKTSEQDKQKELSSVLKKFEDEKRQFEKLENELETPRQELEERKKEEEERKENIEKLQTEISVFSKNLSELETWEMLQPRVAEKNRALRDIQQRTNEVKLEQERIGAEKQQYEDQIRRASDELKKIQNVRHQRLEKIRQRDNHTYNAIMWLQSNQHLFEQPILEPIMMTVNLKDQNYATQVEAALSNKDAMSFVAQNQKDYETFASEVRDKRNMRIYLVRAPNKRLSDYRPSTPLQALLPYGFKKMALDLIEAPEASLCYYCEYHGLHNIPIAGELDPQMIKRIVNEVRLRMFFTASSKYTVIHSRYSKNVITRNSDLMPPRFLVSSVDEERKVEAERAIQEANQSLELFNTRYTKLEEKDKALRNDDSKIRKEKSDLRQKQDSYRRAKQNLRSREERLETFENASAFNLKEEEERYRRELIEIHKRRVECVQSLVTIKKKLSEAAVSKIEASLQRHGAETNVTFLNIRFRESGLELDSAKEEVDVAKHREDRCKRVAQERLSSAQRASGGIKTPEENPELVACFEQLPDNLKDIEDEIHEYEARKEMCSGTDRRVLMEYENRERDIEQKREELDGLVKTISTKEERIKQLEDSWLPALEKLVSEVSERFKLFFAMMKCAGEVSLEKHPSDYSKYGVLIKVKFRDSESLHALNAQRQSGGERSVSTMLYLMALQEHTTCPFRVVDEINQGMDPVNERRVFDLVVKVASESGTSQYFLLTPKLLHDLKYSPSVKVNFLCNGQEMIEEMSAEKFLQ